jgi:vitamin B12 transporter
VKKYLLIMGMICCPLFTYSQQLEQVTITATELDQESVDSSTWVTVIDENAIKDKQHATVAEILRDVPGIDVVSQGGPGQTTSIFIRGSRSEDTLVLIDGIAANDPMSPSGGFDFSSLTSVNIARIEIHRGPQSVRFGSGAMGGVINIITKKGQGPVRYSYLVDAGSYDTGHGLIAASGGTDSYSYSLGADFFQTRGYSAADKNLGNSEPDGAKIGTLSGRVVYRPTKSSEITGTLRYNQAEVDLDSGGGPTGDDPNDLSKSSQFIAGVLGSDLYLNNRLKSTLSYRYSESNRRDTNQPDSASTTDSENYFLSERNQIETTQEWFIDSVQSLKFILAWQEESGISHSDSNGTITSFDHKRLNNLGTGALYFFENASWILDAGLRLDNQSESGSTASNRISIGKRVPKFNSLLRLIYGTGFKNPSLYQLYSSYGDVNLQSQQGRSLDLSWEQKIGKSITASVDVFRTYYNELIDFNTTTNKYQNIASAESRGAELQFEAEVIAGAGLRGNYTYLETRDNSTGSELLRRPRNSWTASAFYRRENFEGSLGYRFVGSRTDLDPVSYSVIKDTSYDLWNLKAQYNFSPNLKLSARVENIFDLSYQEVAGYGTAGRSFFIGISN